MDILDLSGKVVSSVSLGFILCILTEKIIMEITKENSYNERIQSGFVMGFIIGTVFLIIGLVVFGDKSNISNGVIKYSLCGAGLFLMINSLILNWSLIDENIKIVVLGMLTVCIAYYSYNIK